jgi:hypothetical protein
MDPIVAKTNYGHARRQREAARKARQDERLERRRPKPAEAPETPPSADQLAENVPATESGK